ncbi:MAG: hypothetical protein CMJ34_04945 [Phycisphaerae bacterium]|nr:hypothetical protein [Phycisphaerae bacterium]
MQFLTIPTVLCSAFMLSSFDGEGGRPPDCEDLPIGVFDPSWPNTYVESVGSGFPEQLDAAPTVHRTLQPDIVWESLVSLPDSEPVSFYARAWTAPLESPGETGLVTLENPVFVLTLSTSASVIDPSSNPPFGLLQTYAPRYVDGTWVLSEYRANPVDQLNNQWVTIHQPNPDSSTGFSRGTILDFVPRSLGLDRECFNPTINPPAGSGSDPCDAAIFTGVAGVGMPYAFANLGGDVFDSSAGAPWWRQQLFIFVVERDAIIRPSYNPNPRRSSPALRTDDGRPIFDPKGPKGPGYRFPRPDDDLWDAYLDATEGAKPFVGYSDGVTYEGSYGFRQWLARWQENSWGDPPGSDDIDDWADKGAFPFSSIGLTLNWPGFDPDRGSIAEAPFGALSEFIHKGGQSMYLVGIREAHQYVGAPNEFLDEVTWCDTCPGDLNRDGVVDGVDLSILLTNWGSTSTCYTIDKTLPTVGIADLARLLVAWGPCGWPLPEMRPPDCTNAP